ncbi:MAG: molybdopterin-dependent oxidoreductase [Anaerolinea sp.]|nr:molybdopterin-dependent oxidoreductase [Anaerolinea sp.]
MKKPNWLIGIAIGALFTLPVMGIGFLGAQIAGFTFLPFSLFDWTARILPGPIVTFGIDTLVAVLNAINPGANSDTYKQAEQILSLAILPALGGLIGGGFFLLMGGLLRERPRRQPILPGLILGSLMAIVLVAIVLSVPPIRTADILADSIWLAGLLLLWGILLSFVYHRMVYLSPDPHQDTQAHRIDRRRFLVQIGGAAAAITVSGAGVGALLSASRGSNEVTASPAPPSSPATGSQSTPPDSAGSVVPAPGTRPEITPLADHYRIDINLIPPTIDGTTWRLNFTRAQADGTKTTLKSYTLDEIRAFPSRQDYITMACISNPVGGQLISTIKWTGTSFQNVLDDVGIPEGATHVRIYAADGFDEIVALGQVRADARIMLAYEWEDQPLTVEHGFPLRIHIPNTYGMKQPKWITEIEFIDQWQEGYWVRRGWSAEAIVNSTSVIDTVAVDAIYADGGQWFVPLGGIAWAGDRPIGQVQVRIDDGEWQDVRVRTPLSDRTWVIWRFDWPFTPGQHRFEVRCIEADGTPQRETQRGVRPDGALGLHGVTARLNEPPSGT